MAYILDLLNQVIEPRPDRISLERFIAENSYITKYLSRVVKDKALAVYNVLFHLSYFETGKGEIIVPWNTIGSFIRTDQGNIIQDSTTVKRRLRDLLRNRCITVNRQRGHANEIIVHLPSDIPACRELIEKERNVAEEPFGEDKLDYYTDTTRRLEILKRDKYCCVYCLVEVSEDSYFIDHIIPISKGGTNLKNNLVSCCESCNQRKQDQEATQFLLKNYRDKLLTQAEFLKQKAILEKLLDQNN